MSDKKYEIIELDLDDEHMNTMIQAYVQDNMGPEANLTFSAELKSTNSVERALVRAVINEFVLASLENAIQEALHPNDEKNSINEDNVFAGC